MINVTTAMRSRESRANLMLLAKFLRPEQLSELGSYWDEALGESRLGVVNRLIDQGLIIPAPLEVKLDLKIKVPDLKSMLKKQGIKQTGRKAELLARLIENDFASLQKMVGRWRIYQCSDVGRTLALEFETALEAERNQAESDVLELLTEGDYRSASLRMASFEAKQVFKRGLDSRGLEFDWENYDPEIDVIMLECIFSGWPAILNTVTHDLRDALRLGAAMMELFGARTAMQWFEEVPKTNSHLDPDTVIRMICFYGRHQQEMQEYKRMGVRCVTIIGGEDEESCPHCAAISGKKFPLGKAPELPLPTCTSECGCCCIASVC